jgi:hypothetical protein
MFVQLGKFFSVLVFSAISVCSYATEKVFYCEMTGHSEVSLEGVEVLKNGRFKFQVTSQSVNFGSGFGKLQLPLTSNIDGLLYATNQMSSVRFNFPNFYFSALRYGKVTAISALCEDF